MCLLSDNMPVPTRTESERVFYKVLAMGKNGCYYSPYMARPYELNVLHEMDDQEKFDILRYAYGWEIRPCGFHLFVELDDAFREAAYLNQTRVECNGFERYFVVRAVVPEGTLYVEGDYLPDAKCVVVKKVRYEEL